MTATAATKPNLQSGDAFADEAFALAALPRRSDGAHKWGVGGLVLVAGGPSYIGAAALAAMAAGRAGAGIVNVAVPRGAMGAIAAIVPEVAFIPLPEGDLSASSRRARDVIADKLERSKATVIGPGLGDDDYVDALLGALFGRGGDKKPTGFGFGKRAELDDTSTFPSLFGDDKPTVIDADGLNWLAKQHEWWTGMAPRTVVLTPHVGEMARLLEVSTDQVTADARGTATAAARRWNQIVVLKGGHTIATDGKRSLIADDAPLSLATAGTGDVLAGTIGALLAQGVEPLDAAGLAIFLGCRAARRIEERFGTLGLVAGDLPAAIAEEIAILERKRAS